MDNNLQLTETSLGYLNTTRKWTLFFAVLGFIGCGILLLAGIAMIVMGFFAGGMNKEVSATMPFGVLGITYLILGAVSFVPSYYLLKFSNSAKKLCQYKVQEYVDATFLKLKSYYKILGIMTIVMFSLYIIAIPLFIVFYAIAKV